MLSYSWKYDLVILMLLAIALAVTGCGGGGGGKPSMGNPSSKPPIAETTFQVSAMQGATKTIKDVEVSIPANAFSKDANVTVRLYEPERKPNSPSLSVVGSEIEITTSVQPTAPITVSVNDGNAGNYVARTSSSLKSMVYLPISFINGAWKIVGEAITGTGKIRTLIPVDQIILSGLFYSLRMILAAVEIDTQGMEFGLPLLAGKDNNDFENAVILVHGINSSTETMRPLAEALVNAGIYKAAYAFAYNYPDPTVIVANQLKITMENTVDNFQAHVDLIGHSRGVLICRYMMEVMRYNKSVNRAILICGPNEGSRWDTIAELLPRLQEDFLNTSSADGFPIIDTPAVQELLRNSTVAHKLSNLHKGAGQVEYYLFGADKDTLVSMESALALNLNLAESEKRFIHWKPLLNGYHGSVIKDPGPIQSIINGIQ